MRRHAALAGLLVVSPLLLPVAAEAQPQQAPPLTYTQPLAAGALMRVQERLQQAGAYSGRVDGIWGPDSQAALERFQQQRGLQVTGHLNQATAATLGLNPAELVAVGPGPAAAAAAASPSAAMTDTLSPEAVRNVQQRLRVLGFYRGGVDGLWGPGTQTAIERFQQSRGLQSTGQLNPTTLTAMGLDPNNPAARPVPSR